MPVTSPERPVAPAEAPSISALLKRLGNETGELVRAEMALAKLEFSELARQAALDGVKVGAALALAMVGVLALVAWGILALGEVIGDRHGTAALIIGLLLLVIGGVLARSGIRSLARTEGPVATAESWRQNRDWAAGEVRGLQQELAGSTPAPPPPALKNP